MYITVYFYFIKYCNFEKKNVIGVVRELNVDTCTFSRATSIFNRRERALVHPIGDFHRECKRIRVLRPRRCNCKHFRPPERHSQLANVSVNRIACVKSVKTSPSRRRVSRFIEMHRRARRHSTCIW